MRFTKRVLWFIVVHKKNNKIIIISQRTFWVFQRCHRAHDLLPDYIIRSFPQLLDPFSAYFKDFQTLIDLDSSLTEEQIFSNVCNL